MELLHRGWQLKWRQVEEYEIYLDLLWVVCEKGVKEKNRVKNSGLCIEQIMDGSGHF